MESLKIYEGPWPPWPLLPLPMRLMQHHVCTYMIVVNDVTMCYYVYFLCIYVISSCSTCIITSVITKLCDDIEMFVLSTKPSLLCVHHCI